MCCSCEKKKTEGSETFKRKTLVRSGILTHNRFHLGLAPTNNFSTPNESQRRNLSARYGILDVGLIVFKTTVLC